MKRLFLIGLMGLVSVAALAQSGAKKPVVTAKPATATEQKSDTEAQSTQAATPPKPLSPNIDNRGLDPSANMQAPEMRVMASLMMGQWTVEQKFSVSPASPQGGEAKGTVNTRSGPGGHSLMSEIDAGGTFGTMNGFRFLIYDPQAKMLTGFWQDSYSPSVINMNGAWSEEEILLKLAYIKMIDGKKYEFRDVFSGFSKDGYTEVLDMRPAAEPKAAGTKNTAAEKPAEWKRVLNATYTKVQSHPLLWRPGYGPRPSTPPPTKPPEK